MISPKSFRHGVFASLVAVLCLAPAAARAEEAEALAAKEGIPFEEAFRRVAKIGAFPQIIPAPGDGGMWVTLTRPNPPRERS
jgi:hypothetical protein